MRFAIAIYRGQQWGAFNYLRYHPRTGWEYRTFNTPSGWAKAPANAFRHHEYQLIAKNVVFK